MLARAGTALLWLLEAVQLLQLSCVVGLKGQMLQRAATAFPIHMA